MEKKFDIVIKTEKELYDEGIRLRQGYVGQDGD